MELLWSLVLLLGAVAGQRASFVAVGTDQLVYWSGDGMEWMPALVPAAFSSGRGVHYGQRRWVAAGDGNMCSVISSDDGRTWGDCDGFFAQAFEVAFGGNVFVVGGTRRTADNHVISISTDGGRTVRPPVHTPGAEQFCSGITYSPLSGAFVAVTDIGIWRSTDLGNSWSPIAGISDGFDAVFCSPFSLTCLAGTRSNCQARRSLDAGQIWGPTISIANGTRCEFAGYSPVEEAWIMTTSSGPAVPVFFSENDGLTWNVAG